MGTVARLLAEHVSFRCTSVDRIAIRGYIQGLQHEGGVVKFLLNRGNHIPSPAALNRNRERLAAELDALVATSGVPVVRFKGGQSKEEVARPYQDAAMAAGREGLVLVGKAQERTSSWRGFVDGSHAAHRPNHPHISWRRQSSVPDHWYLYFADPEWGPAFLKLCSYAPYPLWCCANGHEWAKHQLAKAGVGFEELDNGLRWVENAAIAHRTCARLGAGHVRDLLGRMMTAMPDPLTIVDRRAGFEWSFPSLNWRSPTPLCSTSLAGPGPGSRRPSATTSTWAAPSACRWSWIARWVNRGKNKTPGRFATEVITRDVAPQLQIHYKSSKAKAYLKERRALRVETTVNNAEDFALHKTLSADNWRALRRIGADTNARFLAAIGEG